MEKEKLEWMMVEYLDGALNEAERQQVELEIGNNPEVAKLFQQTKELLRVMSLTSQLEPSNSFQAKFEKKLEAAIVEENDRRVIKLNINFVYRVAAGLVFALAVGALFYWVNKGIEQDRELAELKAEMGKTKSMLMTMLNNQSSAGQRMQGVSVAYKMEKTDDEIVNALIKTMDQDPNTNVRLAALEALSKFHQQTHVRSALIKSLSTQTDPSVQITLIRLLVEIKEMQTLKELERISTDENALPAVQDEAHAGILKLS